MQSFYQSKLKVAGLVCRVGSFACGDTDCFKATEENFVDVLVGRIGGDDKGTIVSAALVLRWPMPQNSAPSASHLPISM